MESITLGQIIDFVIRLGALVGAVITLVKYTNKGTSKILDAKLQPIKDDLKNERIERLKSDLTTFIYIASINDLSNDQKIRAHEEYDDYIKMGGNSWIHDRFEQLKKEGKI